MARLRSIIDKIIQAKNDLIANREADALRIVLDQTALLKLRIQSTGKDFQGAPFPDYVPAYKNKRQKEGYQIQFVDLTRTGRTLASIEPSIVESSIFAATVIIQGGNSESQAILRGLSKKRGNVLRFSEQEIALAQRANRERILKYFRNL
jgi:hypothetical protein